MWAFSFKIAGEVLKRICKNLNKMNTIVKVFKTIILLFIGFLCLGAPIPYFFGRIILRIALFGAAMYAIGSVWKKKPVEKKG